jgi:hypothetical protein
VNNLLDLLMKVSLHPIRTIHLEGNKAVIGQGKLKLRQPVTQ